MHDSIPTPRGVVILIQGGAQHTGWISAGLTDHYRLAKWLGHANPSTALRLYGHLLPEEDQGDLTGRMADARKRASEISSRAPVVGITGSLPA